MVGFNSIAGVGLVHPRDLKVERTRFEGAERQSANLQMPALKPAIGKDSIHFSGAPDAGADGNAAQDAAKLAGSSQKLAPRLYNDTPKHSRVSPRPSSRNRGPVDEMVKDHVRPFQLDNEPFKSYLSEAYREAAEPYAEQLAEVASRYYQNNAILEVGDDELRNTILALMKHKMGNRQQVKYMEGSDIALQGLESHYSNSKFRPIMQFFTEPADSLLASKDKPVLWLVDRATAATVETLQYKGVLPYIHSHNPNFRFLFTQQPKPLPAKTSHGQYQSAPVRSAQFQVVSVAPLRPEQWVHVLQKHPQAQAILKHYGLTFPERPLTQFMEALIWQQKDPSQPMERESVLAALDSLGSFIRTRLQDKTPEVTEALVGRYFQKDQAPRIQEITPAAEVSSDPFTQKPYKVIKPENITTRMSDIVGHEQAKKALSAALEVAEFPELYKEWNKGDEDAHNNYVLLMGEPGNGKTMLAKAIAAEAKGTFISTGGSEFVNAYVGMGANNMRQIEQEINALPKDELAVLFIEEIDGFSGKREPGSSGREEHKTLNKLLVMTDGIESGGRKLLLIATTNIPESMDKAMISRFHHKIDILNPDKKQREEILRRQLAQKQLVPDSSVDLEELARKTNGLQGRDLRNIMKLAKVNLVSSIPREVKVRLNQDTEARKAFQLRISQKQLEAAVEEFKKGLEDVSKRTAMSKEVAMSYF